MVGKQYQGRTTLNKKKLYATLGKYLLNEAYESIVEFTMALLSRLWSVLIWVIAQPHVTSSLSNKAAGLFGQAFLGAKQLTLRASYIFLIRAVYSLDSLCKANVRKTRRKEKAECMQKEHKILNQSVVCHA